MRMMVLGLLLFSFWLALSGHYTPFLIACGIGISAIAVLATKKTGADDEESVPLERLGGIPRYYPWLIVEIAKSAFAVARIIVNPKLPISPCMTVVDAGQKSTTGIATYANSITLTPGTVTTDVKGKRLTVYALTREGARHVEGGEMDRRVRRFEGEL